jgi:hypothetical protein
MPRTLIESHRGDKRYIRREKGKFTKSQDDVGAVLWWLISSNTPSISGEGDGRIEREGRCKGQQSFLGLGAFDRDVGRR